MKRLNSSDSLTGLIPICQTEEQSSGSKNNNSSHAYNRGFQSMLDGLDEDGCGEEQGHLAEKKRRLSVDQVKALEKSFEVENKLEPERKVKLAHELGLQPRQVAVWFQNRRARWKTKQLERDYGVLKANYETLKLNFESLQQDKEALLAEVRELKSKLLLHEETKESCLSVKEEPPMSESEYIVSEQSKISSTDLTAIQDCHDQHGNDHGINGVSVFGSDFKDGSSDSDSSAILNEDHANNNSSTTAASQLLIMSSTTSPGSSSLRFNNCSSSSSPSSIKCFPFTDSRSILESTQKAIHHQHQHHPFVRMEEHNFFSVVEEETCSFFSEDQAPSLHWYYPTDQWTYNQDPIH